MKIRRPWTYENCEILPIDCSTRGGQPKEFYWRINFPDKSWFHTPTKRSARDYIDSQKKVVIYECGICDCYHPWDWHGDCRDDENRFFPDEIAARLGIDEDDLEIRDWDERCAADSECDWSEPAEFVERDGDRKEGHSP